MFCHDLYILNNKKQAIITRKTRLVKSILQVNNIIYLVILLFIPGNFLQDIYNKRNFYA